MSLNDSLANALEQITKYDSLGMSVVLIKPKSKMIMSVLKILHEKGYVGSYEIVEDNKGGHLKLHLLKKINGCGVIKPRYPVGLEDYEKTEKRYLPAKDFGVVIVSTPNGLMTHDEAIAKKIGGVLIAYCY